MLKVLVSLFAGCLLFSTPVYADYRSNKTCSMYMDSYSEIQDFERIIENNECEVLLFAISKKESWVGIVSKMCDFSYEIIKEETPSRNMVACVPAK